MAVKVAINGFGRIGRLVLRAAMESGRKDIEFVAINDLGSVEANAHLLRHDTMHGPFPGTVKVTKTGIDCGRGVIKVFAERDPANLPWDKLGIDVVMECTGIFTKREQVQAHIDAGARKVLISTPRRARTSPSSTALTTRSCANRTASFPTRPAPPTVWRRSPRC